MSAVWSLTGGKRTWRLCSPTSEFDEADSDGLDQFAARHIVLVNSLLLPAVRVADDIRLANASSSAMEGDWYVGCSRATFGNRRYKLRFLVLPIDPRSLAAVRLGTTIP